MGGKYFNRKGEIVLEFNDSVKAVRKNIDYLDLLNYSPFLSNVNYFPADINSDYKESNDMLTLKIEKCDTILFRSYGGKFKAILLSFYNNSGRDLMIDLPFSVKLQAQDKNGNWRYIEDPNSFIMSEGHGRLEFSKTFQHNKVWNYVIPEYEGNFKTVMRAELIYKKKGSNSDRIKYYSNEISCEINPQQFWRDRSWW